MPARAGTTPPPVSWPRRQGSRGRCGPVTAGVFDDGTITVVGRVYEIVHDGPYPCPDGEVVEIRTVARDELAPFLATHDHCPDSVELALDHLTR